MYVRQPNQNGGNPSRVKLPDNYSGNAFSQPYYNDMPPPVRQSAPARSEPPAKSPPPQIDLPPKSSPLAEQLRNPQISFAQAQERQEYITPPYASKDDSRHEQLREEPIFDEDTTKPAEKQERTAPSLLSSLIPKASLSGNFPFGHGIGSEELLILGIMLLVYLSGAERGEIDGEFIVLLGLLLFAG